MNTTTTILAAGVLPGGAAAADPGPALPRTVTGTADNNVMEFAVSLANEGAEPTKAFAAAPLLGVAPLEISGSLQSKVVGTGKPDLLESAADSAGLEPANVVPKAEQKSVETAACTNPDVTLRDLSQSIESSVAEFPSVTKFLGEVQHGAMLQLDTLHGARGRTRLHLPSDRNEKNLPGSGERADENSAEETAVSVAVQTATPTFVETTPQPPSRCQDPTVARVDSDPLAVPAPSASCLNANFLPREAPTAGEEKAVSAGTPAFSEIVPVSSNKHPMTSTPCRVRSDGNVFSGVPAAAGYHTGLLTSSMRLQEGFAISNPVPHNDELSANLVTDGSGAGVRFSLPESASVPRNGLPKKQASDSDGPMQTNIAVPADADVPRKEVGPEGALPEVQHASSQVIAAGPVASYTSGSQANPVVKNVAGRSVRPAIKSTSATQQMTPGAVQPVFSSALQSVGVQVTVLDKASGPALSEQPAPLRMDVQSDLAAHPEATPAPVPGAKQASTIEVGIHDSQLGQLRIQTTVNSAGEIQVGLAGQRAESQIVLEQITPLLHAAISQQSGPHELSTPVHVFTIGAASAMRGDSAKQDSGSQPGSMSYTASGSSSMHSQHSSNHQARQETQQAQRRGSHAINSAAGTWHAQQQKPSTLQYAFQGTPAVSSHGGLSIHI